MAPHEPTSHAPAAPSESGAAASSDARGAVNRLARASSPYLRQHQHNPVDWYPWGPEALALARELDRPILLSIGYSACHWCHVMAHESFEDPATAAIMNAHFVNVKVDREERPDLDVIYQKVVQLMGQGGGWPLTVFLTPVGEPFYGGTYFPPQPRHGRPGFAQLLHAIAQLWSDRRDDVAMQVESLREGMQSMATIVDQERAQAGGAPPLGTVAALREAVGRLLVRVDPQWGGFGREPKFPNPTALELLAMLARGPSGDRVATDSGNALRLTLDKLYEGGIYDHLRGGFARYSTDRRWLVPHFEKMLYDNAQLLPLFAEAALAWPEAEHLQRVAVETVEYLQADMRAEEGTYFSATDADSEGEEGKYFCWTRDEIAALVEDEDLRELFFRVYGCAPGGNFEHDRSILHLPRPLADVASARDTDVATLLASLAPVRARLLAQRAGRVPPLRDEKILTGPNALLASGLLRAAAALEQHRQAWTTLAQTCLETLWQRHRDADGRVLRSGFEGVVHLRAVLDDVAALGRACLDLHEATLAPQWLDRAASLAEELVQHHARAELDGLWFTADDAERLIERSESQHDGPMPSGVALAVELLARLDACERAPEQARGLLDGILDRFRGASTQPFGYASLVRAALFAGAEVPHVKLYAADPQAATVQRWRAQLATVRTQRVLPIAWSWHASPRTFAVVCRQQTCSAPLLDDDALRAALG